jgi:hypothetical protein
LKKEKKKFITAVALKKLKPVNIFHGATSSSFFLDHFSSSFDYFSKITAIRQQIFILPQERALPTQGGAERGG